MSKRRNLKTWLVMTVFLLGMLSTTFAGQIIYVDTDAPGPVGDGSSWTDAYNYLQDALADANSGDEIRVAQGIYKPDQGVGITSCDRTATFQLINGIAIKGGHAGFGEPDPNARDIELYETILSGDLDGNDIDVNDPADLQDEPTRGENSYHVVTGSGTDETAALDGFTIEGGNADGPWQGPQDTGGGMLNSGSPTVANCTFSNNWAYHGGGMYNYGESLTLTNCTFSRNSADWSGGGMSDCGGSLTLINCTFSGNSAYNGGGMDNSYNTPVLINCRFSGNSAENGGGIDNFNNRPTLINCTFAGNSANYGGRGISISHFSNLTVTNCIFWGNAADIGPEIWDIDSVTVRVTYSDVQGGWPGEGNIDQDPCFADPGYWDANGTPEDANDDFWVDGDYHLKSQAGRLDANEGRWTKDDVTSPCIDGGDMASPIGYEPFPNGGLINMGAYGGTAEASKSYFGEPVCETIVAGDINGDCKVNFLDFRLMALHWLRDENQ